MLFYNLIMITENKIRQPIVTVCGHVDHGKCVSGDTIIPLSDGTLISAKELFEKNYDKSLAKKQGKDIIQKTDKITLFNKINSKIFPTKISHIWKREKEELIEIKTSHGDILKTTPEHPYFKFSLEKDLETKAEDLIEGDFIAVPSRIRTRNINPKIIILNNLRNFNFLCFLDPNPDFFKKIKKAGISKLQRKLMIKNLENSLKKSRIRFRDLDKLSDHFKISDIERYDLIKGIKNSSEVQRAGHTSKIIKLPDFNEPEKFGYVLGCIAGDGHLSKSQVLLDNNDKDIQEKYSEYLKEIFDTECILKQNHTCQTVVNKGGLTFKLFLRDIIGIPDKQKSANVEVPLIVQKNKEMFKGFFAGLLDTDGYVSKINNSIELTSKSNKLIRQCSILLLNFGILCSVFEKNSFYVLRISNKEYLGKFMENFNLRLTRKLKRVINAYEKSQSSRIFDIFPLDKQELKKLKLPSKPNRVIPYFNKYLKSQNITRNFLKRVLENTTKKDEVYEKINLKLREEIRYVRIVSKKKIRNSEKYVYDFTVPETHNFIAERTIVHNTSILDRLRDSCVQEGESGGITQKISFTSYPLEQLKKSCSLIEKSGINLEIPGFLFIDTPGHAAFTNLRKRGGALADLAVLVIDINEGIKPQTAEVIKIMKMNKTPFLIALNKIDNLSGWLKREGGIKEKIDSQPPQVKQMFDEKYMTLIGALNSYGFDSDLFYNVEDFSKKIALIPTSAKNGEGIEELIMMLCGLSQKYLKDRLTLHPDAKGVMLEIKKEKSNHYIEAILYDGKLSRTDEIAIATFDGEPIITKIRILEKIQPLCSRFKAIEEVTAATGIRMQLMEKEKVLPGMPFVVYKKNKEEIKEKFGKEVGDKIQTEKSGIIAKADSLGSLEALLTLLKQSNVPVVKAGIGNVGKSDIISAKANMDINELDAVIVGFNVEIDEDAREILGKTRVILDDVVYKLIENLQEFRREKQSEIEKTRLMEMATICKLKILPQYVFRNSNPAIFGCKIETGKLVSNTPIIDDQGNKIGRIKNIQSENRSVSEAKEGMEVAISIPGTNFERQLSDKQFLYSDFGSSQFKTFKKNKDLLSQNEIKTLSEVADIKRKNKVDWGI
jgi:translation initiation factor 5B